MNSGDKLPNPPMHVLVLGRIIIIIIIIIKNVHYYSDTIAKTLQGHFT